MAHKPICSIPGCVDEVSFLTHDGIFTILPGMRGNEVIGKLEEAKEPFHLSKAGFAQNRVGNYAIETSAHSFIFGESKLVRIERKD